MHLRQSSIFYQVRNSMGDFGAGRGDEIVKNARRNILFVRQQRVHHCVQVRSHNAFRPTQAIHRFQP